MFICIQISTPRFYQPSPWHIEDIFLKTKVENRAVRIEHFTARVLHRVSFRVLINLLPITGGRAWQVMFWCWCRCTVSARYRSSICTSISVRSLWNVQAGAGITTLLIRLEFFSFLIATVDSYFSIIVFDDDVQVGLLCFPVGDRVHIFYNNRYRCRRFLVLTLCVAFYKFF